mgnify:CR=1 FL=1
MKCSCDRCKDADMHEMQEEYEREFYGSEVFLDDSA